MFDSIFIFSECRRGSIKIETTNRCITLYNDQKLNMMDARAACTNRQENLVIFENQAQYDALETYLR